MGIILGQEFKIVIRKNTIEYYNSFGYDVKLKDVLYVPPNQLPNGSGKRITIFQIY